MKVKNLNDKGGRPVPAGHSSWLAWWKAQMGLYPSSTVSCANNGCRNTATLGGHVKKVNSDDDRWYMVPLCHGCNQLKDPFDVNAAEMIRIASD